MNRIFSLQNSIQPYAWGSRTAIADLLGKPGPTTNPQAELWMGAHPESLLEGLVPGALAKSRSPDQR